MNKSLLFALALLLTSTFSWAQREHHVDFMYGYGTKNSSISGHIVKNFKLLKNEKLHVGVGGRAFYFYGGTTLYTTGPNKHALYSERVDTLSLDKPSIITANLSLNAKYLITPKLAVGFSFDLAGFSFGKKKYATFYPGKAAQETTPPGTVTFGNQIRPSANALFLTGNYSKGSLCSEFFIRYTPIERFSIKAGYSIFSTEYSSTKRIGYKDNYRFRNTSGQIVFGLGYNFI